MKKRYSLVVTIFLMFLLFLVFASVGLAAEWIECGPPIECTTQGGFICYNANQDLIDWRWWPGAAYSETNCDDTFDNDCNSYVDEADSNCALSLEFSSSSPEPNQIIIATVTGVDNSLTTGGFNVQLCDYLGCNADASCAGVIFGSQSAGGSSVNFGLAAPPGCDTFTYYACTGENQVSNTFTTDCGGHCDGSTHTEGDEVSGGDYPHTYTVATGVWDVGEDCDNLDWITCGCPGAGTSSLSRECDDYLCSGGSCSTSPTWTAGGPWTCDATKASSGTNVYGDNGFCSVQYCESNPPSSNDKYLCKKENNAASYTWIKRDDLSTNSETDCGDGYDNDCDGDIDSSDSDCCVSTGSDDPCDGIDNNCDGTVDEGCGGECLDGETPQPTTCGVGACSGNTGIETCTAGSWGGDTCDPLDGATADTSCDGTDNDCDGSIDEDFVSTTTSCGVGACASEGLTSCAGGSLIDSCTPGTPTPELCSDSLDNDCNGLTDCQDPDCEGSISGRVNDTDDNNIGDAKIDATQQTILKYTEFTQSLGEYTINNVKCGTYDMTASADTYVSSTQNIQLQPNEQLQNIDFTLILGTTCEDDCTYAGDTTVHQECDGINGCEFCDSALGCGFCDKQKVADSCNLAQPGWVREYYDDTPSRCDDGCLIECAEGCPKAKIKVKATVTCELENLIKATKLVTYNGKLVKLIVAVCG